MTGLALALSRGRTKTAVDTAGIRLSRALRWSDVLGALQWDETRSDALNHYRAGGFTPDDFRLLPARARMVEALTRVEDWLEFRRGSRAVVEAERIREVRHRLECEVDA